MDLVLTVLTTLALMMYRIITEQKIQKAIKPANNVQLEVRVNDDLIKDEEAFTKLYYAIMR